jgi:hypothetical protein
MHPLRNDPSFEKEKSLNEIKAMEEICKPSSSKEFIEIFKEYEL